MSALAVARTAWRKREPRRAVIIPSRMKAGGQWVDMCIHNLSLRGLMAASDHAPEPGFYVDIRRGSHVIIGRVVWRQDRFFGVRTQDRIDIEAVISEPRRGKRTQPRRDPPSLDQQTADRLRAEARLGRRIERSREKSAMMQFVAIGGVAISAAFFVASEVRTRLGDPLAIVTRAMTPKR